MVWAFCTVVGEIEKQSCRSPFEVRIQERIVLVGHDAPEGVEASLHVAARTLAMAKSEWTSYELPGSWYRCGPAACLVRPVVRTGYLTRGDARRA